MSTNGYRPNLLPLLISYGFGPFL